MCCRTFLWCHEFSFLEFFESHVTKIVDSFIPGVAWFVVFDYVCNFFLEDIESVLGLGKIFGGELLVDFLGDLIGQSLMT